MFCAFTDKVRGSLSGVKSSSVEHVAPHNAKVDHVEGVSASTIIETSIAWDKLKDKVDYVKDGIAQSINLYFGNVAYCMKGREGKDTTNTWDDIKVGADATRNASKDFDRGDFDIERFIGSGFEAATDDITNTWCDIKARTNSTPKARKNVPLVALDVERALGSGFEAATDDFTTNTWIDIQITDNPTVQASKDFPLVDLDVENFVGSGFEAATDEFVNVTSVKEGLSKALNSVSSLNAASSLNAVSSLNDNLKEVPSNENFVSSAADNMKLTVRKDGLIDKKATLEGITDITRDQSTFILVQRNKELEKASAETGARHGWVALLVR